MKLAYYSHRFRNADPAVQAENLRLAQCGFRFWFIVYARKGIVLHAPWLALAEAGVPEDKALAVIRASITASDFIVADFDGQPESVGMADERLQAEAEGKPVIEVGR